MSLGKGLLGLGTAILAAACGGGGGGSGPGGSPASVAGIVVVHADVARRDPTALGTAPAEFGGEPTSATAALAHADWMVADAMLAGTTADDGTFAIDGLSPGRHVLDVTRTLGGDLVDASLPFAVGDDGAATVVAELAWGMSRVRSSYLRDGTDADQIVGPSGASVVIEGGRIVELGDGVRLLRDTDRDGRFDACEVVAEVGTCVVAQIGALLTQLPETVRVGADAYVQAVLTLDDGSALDVSGVVAWRSSDESVASIDAFGRLTARAAGDAEIQARLGDLGSLVTTLHVVERGALLRIQVQNASCYYPIGVDGGAGAPRPGPLPPPTDEGVWAPTCRQVIEIGGQIAFIAIGEYADGDFQDLSAEVTWSVDPAGIGDLAGGTFTGRAAGSGTITARLGEVASEPTDVRVVTEPTLVAIAIYTNDGGVLQPPVPGSEGGAARTQDDVPCVGCSGFALTVLLGDTLPLAANGEYDTGAFRDLTDRVTWRSSNGAVVQVGTGSKLRAVAAGEADVTASLDGLTSEPAHVTVVASATLQSLWIWQSGDRVVAKNDQRFFTANGSYDIGFGRDVTKDATWRTSDASIARFDAPGVLTGAGAGTVEVWAELDGIASDRVALEVFETSELDYCDPANVNRGTWTDGFNRVLLETDCATYTQPGVAALRFTVTESTSPGGIFDPCLDLYVFQGDRKVRTIREEGCGEAFTPAPADGGSDDVLKYQVRAFWDLKDDAGAPVAPGAYQIHGRFYLYYDPVVSLTVTIE
ncbi:Ig-like domain-containing protein [Candidatus Binatia bacterium]|nr:Ig-like domain-containing protein [Candidatus Binatia bacterium]